MGRWARTGLWGVLAATVAAAVALRPAPTSAAATNPSVYVTNVSSNTVSQYNAGAGGALSPKAPATVATPGPFAIAISPNGGSVYVTNGNGTNHNGTNHNGTVSQYDVGPGGALSPKTPATVATRATPFAIAVSPDGTHVYVTNGDDQFAVPSAVSQYDVGPGGVLSPKTPATVATGEGPYGIAVSPDGTGVYVTNRSNTVSQYSVGHDGALSPKTPATVASTNGGFGIAASPDGTSVYVTNGGYSVAQFSVAPGGVLIPKAPATVATTLSPTGIAVSPDGTSVYVANQGAGTVSQYSVGPAGALTPKTPATVGVPSTNPVGIVVSPDGASVYVTNFSGNPPNGVFQYSVGPSGALSPKSPATVATGMNPYGIAVSPLPLAPRPTTLRHATGHPPNPPPRPRSVSRLPATGDDLKYLVLGEATLLAGLVGHRRLRRPSRSRLPN